MERADAGALERRGIGTAFDRIARRQRRRDERTRGVGG